MFDIAPSEFLLVAFIALVVIGPKDLPKALRVVGYWVGRARAVGRQFRSGFDEMVREAELAEMEKKWKAENERIMREHAPSHAGNDAPSASPTVADDAAPVMVAQPQMIESAHAIATGQLSEPVVHHGVDARAPIDSPAPNGAEGEVKNDRAAS